MTGYHNTGYHSIVKIFPVTITLVTTPPVTITVVIVHRGDSIDRYICTYFIRCISALELLLIYRLEGTLITRDLRPNQ